MPLFSLPSLVILAGSFAAWVVLFLILRKGDAAKAPEFITGKGRILRCWKEDLANPGDEPPGDLWVEFEFDWQGEKIKTDDVAEPDEDLARYEPGREVTVWIHPANAKQACLHSPDQVLASSNILSPPLFFLTVVTWLCVLFIVGVLGIGRAE